MINLLLQHQYLILELGVFDPLVQVLLVGFPQLQVYLIVRLDQLRHLALSLRVVVVARRLLRR